MSSIEKLLASHFTITLLQDRQTDELTNAQTIVYSYVMPAGLSSQSTSFFWRVRDGLAWWTSANLNRWRQLSGPIRVKLSKYVSNSRPSLPKLPGKRAVCLHSEHQQVLRGPGRWQHLSGLCVRAHKGSYDTLPSTTTLKTNCNGYFHNVWLWVFAYEKSPRFNSQLDPGGVFSLFAKLTWTFHYWNRPAVLDTSSWQKTLHTCNSRRSG